MTTAITCADDPPRRVAAVITEWRRHSHADVLLSRLLEPEAWRDTRPFGLKLAAIYADQFPANDLCRPLCEKHGVPVFPTIREAIGVGSRGVDVDGVLLIGEHGDYASNRRGQKMYPRARLFDGIVHAFRLAGRRVPVFNDKHLSYDWLSARWMYDLARHEGIPLLAGSSIPVAWRAGVSTLPLGTPLTAALGVGYADIEAYGFHALEGLQCMIERREGGARGPNRVRCLGLEPVMDRIAPGRPTRELLDALWPVRRGLDPGITLPPPRALRGSALFLLDYGDLTAEVLMLEGVGECFGFVGRRPNGAIEPTVFALEPGPPFGHFGHLLRAIEHTIQTGRPAYPAERTLITTGALDALLHSRAQSGDWIPTPHLAAITYTPADWPFAPGARGTPA